MPTRSDQVPTGATRGRAGQHLLGVGALLLVFVIGYVVPRYVEVSIVPPAPPPVSDGYLPRAVIEGGPQYVMIFAGSHTCQASAHGDLPEAVERIKLKMARLASEQGATFKAIGLSLGWSVGEADAFLRQFGQFDEIAAGGSWTNLVLVDHVWSEGARPSTPLVALYHRTLSVPQDSTDLDVLRATPARLVTYSRGVEAILELSESSLESRFLAPATDPGPVAISPSTKEES